MRVPWTAGRSNQSILEEISPEYSLEGLRLKLTLQSSGHLTQRTDCLEKTSMEGRRRQGRHDTPEDEMVWWHRNSMGMSLSKLRELVMAREAWAAAVH